MEGGYMLGKPVILQHVQKSSFASIIKPQEQEFPRLFPQSYKQFMRLIKKITLKNLQSTPEDVCIYFVLFLKLGPELVLPKLAPSRGSIMFSSIRQFSSVALPDCLTPKMIYLPFLLINPTHKDLVIMLIKTLAHSTCGQSERSKFK